MSMRPWPLRLKRITSSRPSSLALRAARMVAAMAWVDSGAGMIPSARAKKDAGLKGLVLRDCYGVDVAVLYQLAHNLAATVVAETCGVDLLWLEVASK